MHPLFTPKTRLFVYVLLWLPMVLALSEYLSNEKNWVFWESIFFSFVAIIVFAFVCLSTFYVCRAIPVVRSRLLTVLFNQLVGAALALVLWSAWLLIAVMLIGLISPRDGHVNDILESLTFLMPVALILYLLSVAIHYLLISLDQQGKARTREAQLQTLAREAELRMLRAQINPHFLFNSLNSISALTSMDPARARNMCLMLAEFFRKNLDLEEKELSTLSQEVELARNYLEIEKVRFGDRLHVQIDLPEELEAIKVPPLLLQPLVENAVKHGVAGMVDGGTIQIHALQGRDGRIEIVVENPFDPDSRRNAHRRGIGISNVRKRLEYRFGEESSMEIDRENERFRVTLLLPSTVVAQPTGR
jgi:LytS/YehU family sensor histidine kinase